MACGIDWFRWHHGSVNDQKFQLVAKKAGASVAEVIALWACLLEAASMAEDRGNPGQPDFEALDCALGVQDGRCAAVYAQMRGRGLIDAQGRLVAWAKRQPKREREDDSTERVQRYRERVRAGGGVVGGYLKHHAFLMERDSGRCVYCNTPENLCIDHMVPIVQGGDDEPDNLAMACKACNSGKSGRTPEEAGYEILSEAAKSAYLSSKSRHLSRLSRQITPREEKSREEKETTPAGFAGFWSAWPKSDRKQAKGKCLEAWKKAGAEPHAALVVAHVEAMKRSASWTKDGGQYIPAPLVYLNKRSWEGAEIADDDPYGLKTAVNA